MNAKKHHLPLLLALLGILIIIPARADENDALQNPSLQGLYSELQSRFRKQYPTVASHLLKNRIRFECDTRTFMVRERNMSGQWQNPSAERGPKAGGILCEIVIEKGQYQGQAVAPQTFDKRYFKVLLLAPYSNKKDVHLEVHLAYPKNVTEPFLKQFTDWVNAFDRYVH